MAFDEKTQGVITLADFATALEPGKEHTVELRMDQGAEMPFSFGISYFSEQPANAPTCKLSLTTSLPKAQLTEGDIVDARVEVANITDEAAPMAVAIVGLPGGLEPRHDQLKELVKKGVIAAYEVMGREVVLYWRTLKPKQRVDLGLSLVAVVPGTYEGPAGRVYQYYTDELKQWAPGLRADIQAR